MLSSYNTVDALGGDSSLSAAALRYLASEYGITNTERFVTTFFTNSTTAFHELARAAEGVVRDLLNIFMHAFFTSQRKDQAKIDKRTIIEAAQQWFEQDNAVGVLKQGETVNLSEVMQIHPVTGEVDWWGRIR